MASVFLNPLIRLSALLSLPLLCACSSLLFYPMKQHVATPERWQLDYEDVWLSSADGVRLHGWWLPADSARGTVYFLHGNAENISTHIASVAWLPGEGYNVFLLDYRGYGRSEGEPSLPAVIADVRAGLDWVRARPDGLPLTVLGQSLGAALGGFAVATDTGTPPAGLVLDAPVASYPRIAAEVARRSWVTWPLAPLVRRMMPADYNLIDVIERLRGVPLLVFRSDEDSVIPPAHGDDVFTRAVVPKWRRATTGPHIATFAAVENRRLLLCFLAGAAEGAQPAIEELRQCDLAPVSRQ